VKIDQIARGGSQNSAALSLLSPNRRKIFFYKNNLPQLREMAARFKLGITLHMLSDDDRAMGILFLQKQPATTACWNQHCNVPAGNRKHAAAGKCHAALRRFCHEKAPIISQRVGNSIAGCVKRGSEEARFKICHLLVTQDQHAGCHNEQQRFCLFMKEQNCVESTEVLTLKNFTEKSSPMIYAVTPLIL